MEGALCQWRRVVNEWRRRVSDDDDMSFVSSPCIAKISTTAGELNAGITA